MITSRPLKRSLLALSCLLVLGYGGYQLRDIMAGPQLQITYPENGVRLERDHLVLAGTSKDIASLHINGRQIFTDQDGNFTQDLLLLNGYNVIEVRATDRLNRATTKRLELTLAPRAHAKPLARVPGRI
ncbi:MAG: hypothetical protein A2542_02765 [Parcubacteria group bacterium RIFOXYD2_FULL_52_8]|nr:MAG: hypothetical protein A2542_02765 [Parcubacteria group bacterium RIFOXYD2_FULL_52_8]